jgi:4a-hydroxytetrahydrobiopterin dehydratase
MDLAHKKCVPCEGGIDPFTREQAAPYLAVVPGWELDGRSTSIHREYRFSDFKAALAFVNKVGAIAESEGHHPDIELGWGKVAITLSTHAIKGLSENDFIVAYKIDADHS